MNEIKQQTIELYARQLRIPAFNHYSDVIRQLEKRKDMKIQTSASPLMKQELNSQQESTRKRIIKSANFPYLKTMNELDYSWIKRRDEAFIKELASCDFVSSKQNIVMIGNPRTGKIYLSIALGIKACM